MHQGEGEEADERGIFYDLLEYKVSLKEVAENLRLLGKIACPVAMTSLLLHSKSIISMLFLGQLGNSELAGGSLAISFANITGFSIMKGLSMGMEPICSQAYGAKKWSVISQAFQRTLSMLSITAVAISVLWLNMEPLLLLLGQDRHITQVAKVYLRYSILELVAQVHLHPLRVFLRTQSITKPIAMASAVGLLLHIPINYFLVIYLNLGVKGVALASAFNTITLNLALLLYLDQSRTIHTKPWDGMSMSTTIFDFSAALLNLIKGYWRSVFALDHHDLALPSVLAVCLEWWWYEIILFLCGLLHNPRASVAAMGILIQTTGLVYVIPHALSLGLSTRVGQELGAGQASRARQTTVIGLTVAVAMGMAAFGFMVSVRSVWGRMYTSDRETLSLVSTALPVLGLCEIGNSPQTAACGALRGCARPKVGAQINFVAFYLIGLPVAALAAFALKIGFIGLWFGLVAAQASCMCMLMYVLVRTDWNDQVKRAEELTRVAVAVAVADQGTDQLDHDLESTLL
ncbi:hypothetical protein Dimus_006902 [Dionaea muscipula]